jgi:hypothetical protein
MEVCRPAIGVATLIVTAHRSGWSHCDGLLITPHILFHPFSMHICQFDYGDYSEIDRNCLRSVVMDLYKK